MNCLSYFDIYGVPFTFTTFKNKLFKTSIGGAISILCAIVGIVFTFIFGSNFFFRKNPISLSQTVMPAQYDDPFKLNSTSFPIAWSIVDLDNRPVNFTGVIYPIITFYFFDMDGKSELLLSKKVNMNITKCNQYNANLTSFNESLNPDQWYCLDWNAEDYRLGGYWDGNYVYDLNIALYYCPNGDNYKEGIGCTSFDDFIYKTATSNKWYFSIMYPQATFEPNSNNPLKISYKNYFYAFDTSLRKLDRIFFDQIHVSDDQGWILTDVKNYTALSFNDLKSDYNYFGSENYNKTGIGTGFYSCYFYGMKSYQLHSRSYMKFQELCAIVGGFLKIIILAGEVLSFMISGSYMNEYLMNELFSFENEKIE